MLLIAVMFCFLLRYEEVYPSLPQKSRPLECVMEAGDIMYVIAFCFAKSMYPWVTEVHPVHAFSFVIDMFRRDGTIPLLILETRWQ